MKRLLGALSLALVVGLSVAGAASVLASSPSSSPSEASGGNGSQQGGDRVARSGEAEGARTHGGQVERFHETAGCGLADTSSLRGNWTHGDYVSAVASGGSHAEIQAAARSNCGKPIVAVNHAGGPPAHALENRAAAHGNAGNVSGEAVGVTVGATTAS